MEIFIGKKILKKFFLNTYVNNFFYFYSNTLLGPSYVDLDNTWWPNQGEVIENVNRDKGFL